MMPTSELEYLKSIVGCTYSANGFLSTSKDINKAKEFLLGAVNTENHKAVLFEITVNAPNLTNVVFVDIDKYTGHIDEEEILFDMNTIFKTKSVGYDPEQNLWIIQMEATDEGTYQMKEKLNKARKTFQNGNMNLLFGRMLLDMKQYHKAESYFQMLLQILPELHKDLPFVYDHIADLNMRITNYTGALQNSILALQMKQKILPSNHPEIGETWNNIANYYKAIGDNVRALKSYKRTLHCKPDQYTKAITQLNISAIHLRNNNYDQAHTLCIKAYKTLQRIHPCPHAGMIYSHGIMAEIYFTQKQYNNAEDYYDRALKMTKLFLSIGHRYQTNCVKALAHLYNKQGKNEQAIAFCLKWLSWYEEDLPSNHMAIAYLSMIIGELSSDNDDQKRSSLERALNILEKNRHLEYATIANCLIMLAQYCQKRNDKNKPLKYCTGACEIRKQIYPTDHSIITETEDLIKSINRQT